MYTVLGTLYYPLYTLSHAFSRATWPLTVLPCLCRFSIVSSNIYICIYICIRAKSLSLQVSEKTSVIWLKVESDIRTMHPAPGVCIQWVCIFSLERSDLCKLLSNYDTWPPRRQVSTVKAGKSGGPSKREEYLFARLQAKRRGTMRQLHGQSQSQITHFFSWPALVCPV